MHMQLHSTLASLGGGGRTHRKRFLNARVTRGVGGCDVEQLLLLHAASGNLA